MMFFDLWIVGEIILALLMIAAGVFGFKKARKLHHRFARFGLRLVSMPLAGVGTVFALLLISILIFSRMWGCEKDSAPIYSPSGDLAVRVENTDEGALGGETYVVLYWAHGIRIETVYFGPWASVEPKDVRWVSDSELAIQYAYTFSGDGYYCKSLRNVSVTCSLRRTKE
ncbi:MAG: hypothetical protein ACLQLH_08175 [Terracidiphilus sp.]